VRPSQAADFSGTAQAAGFSGTAEPRRRRRRCGRAQAAASAARPSPGGGLQRRDPASCEASWAVCGGAAASACASVAASPGISPGTSGYPISGLQRHGRAQAAGRQPQARPGHRHQRPWPSQVRAPAAGTPGSRASATRLRPGPQTPAARPGQTANAGHRPRPSGRRQLRGRASWRAPAARNPDEVASAGPGPARSRASAARPAADDKRQPHGPPRTTDINHTARPRWRAPRSRFKHGP
jgi:hypothetical protein